MTDQNLAKLYNYELNHDMPFYLTKNAGGLDWTVNKYLLR
jgi:hypothetical protein